MNKNKFIFVYIIQNTLTASNFNITYQFDIILYTNLLLEIKKKIECE